MVTVEANENLTETKVDVKQWDIWGDKYFVTFSHFFLTVLSDFYNFLTRFYNFLMSK